MHRYFHIALLSGLGFGAPLDTGAAPAGDASLTIEDTIAVLRLARTTNARLRCSPVEPGAPASAANISTPAEYGEIAGMYAYAATHYPPVTKGDRVSQINDLVDEAARAYQSAYECVPGMHSALHLHRAIHLLRTRVEELGPTDERAQQFAAQITKLQAALPTPPACPTCETCATCPPPPPPTAGYRSQYAERVALSIGLGGGQTFIGGPVSRTLGHFTLRFALGPRFVLGERERHIMGAGLHYALHAILQVDGAPPSRPSAIHQAGPYVEYGFIPHPQISFHANVGLAVTAGVVALDPNDIEQPHSFQSINLGAGAAVCTLGASLCARLQGRGSVTQDSTKMAGYDVTLHLDFFRLTDLLLTRSSASGGNSGGSAH